MLILNTFYLQNHRKLLQWTTFDQDYSQERVNIAIHRCIGNLKNTHVGDHRRVNTWEGPYIGMLGILTSECYPYIGMLAIHTSECYPYIEAPNFEENSELQTPTVY